MSETEQELARDPGFLEAYTIGLRTIIRAGIFVLPSIAAEQAVFGSLPETITEAVDGTVVITRRPEESPMSIREALVQRLEV